MSDKNPVVFIAADHRGFEIKRKIQEYQSDVEWCDLGPETSDRVNYPNYASLVSAKVQENPGSRGILVCGSGQGMAIRANKYPGIRAALCWDVESCRLSREHNNANVLCLGADLLGWEKIQEIIPIFLNTEFEGGRHIERVEMLSAPVPGSESGSQCV